MNQKIKDVLTNLDAFRMDDEMTYSAYSTLHDKISLLDDLLKEPEPVKPYFSSYYNEKMWHCGTCGKFIDSSDLYCRRCGKAVDWR